MSTNDISTHHQDSSKKLELINSLIEKLNSRESIDYSEYNPSTNTHVTEEILTKLNEQKDVEVKALTNAWEMLEDLLFNDLQITLQEKNVLASYLAYKKKATKQKRRSGSNVSGVWRAND